MSIAPFVLPPPRATTSVAQPLGTRRLMPTATVQLVLFPLVEHPPTPRVARLAQRPSFLPLVEEPVSSPPLLVAVSSSTLVALLTATFSTIPARLVVLLPFVCGRLSGLHVGLLPRPSSAALLPALQLKPPPFVRLPSYAWFLGGLPLVPLRRLPFHFTWIATVSPRPLTLFSG